MTTTNQRITAHPFFADFPAELLPKISFLAGVGHFHAGQHLFRTGEPAKHFYLINSGQISLEVNLDGHGPVVLNFLNGGDALGWSWLSAPFFWQFDAKTVHEAEAIILDAEKLRREMAQNFEFSHHFYQAIMPVITQRLQAARARLMEFYHIFPAPAADRPGWQRLLPDGE